MEPNHKRSGKDGHKDEVLVVDDNLQNLKLLEEVLVEAGYQVRLARDGELALRSAVLQQPSLILLDIRMPGMDGFEVCQRLKANKRTCNVPIIFISILEDEHDKVDAFLAGAVDYITKPFQPEEVLARIQTHLRLRDLTERLEQVVGQRTSELTLANQRLELEIAERRQAEVEVRQHLIQQKALLDLYRKMAAVPVPDIIDFIVDSCVSLTGSAIGFVGLISDDDQHMEAHIWSETVMKNCSLNKPLLFPIDEAGLWAESIRQRRMIIVNDFSTPNPCRKGYPDGHLELVRFMGVPVVDQGRVVAVAGVANREEGYAESDHDKVSLLLEGMWDLIKRKRAEEEMCRLNRELQAISNCNQTLMKAEDEQILLNDICRIICDEAGYCLAWVGYAEHDPDKTIRPMAWAGEGSGHVDLAHISWSDDSERGQGPAGMAIRTGEPIHVDDYETDPHMITWREIFWAHGYRSGVALPLKNDKATVFGVLLIYSTELHAVTAQELKLLEGLAGDLAFGITVLRTRMRRNEVEAALQENQRLLLEAQHMAHIGNWWHDMITGEIHWSDECFRIVGREPQEVTLELERACIHPDDLSILLKAMEESAAGKIEHEHDFRITRPDGEIRWIHNHWLRVNDQDGKEIKRVGTHQDITEQKIAEEKLRKLNTELDQRVKKRTAELEAKNEELERMNQLFVGRELKMVELKKKIQELEKRINIGLQVKGKGRNGYGQ